MDTKFSVIYNGEIADNMVIAEVEKNLQQQYRLSEKKSKQFLSKQRTVKNGLTKIQALRLQKKLLSNGLKTRLISDPSQPVESVNNTLSRDKIDAIFKGEITPIQASRPYDLGLLLTLLLILCIPTLYLMVSGLVIYNMGISIASIITWFDFQHLYLIKGLVVFSVIFVGALVGFFLLRPLIPRNHCNNDDILDPAEHSDLFYLIQALSRYMSVPMPSEIRINNKVNASVSLREGIRDIKQGELVLTLGCPLVSGMNTRQLVGIIAHEFGHYSQRNEMVVYYLINTINVWLQERAYANDGLILLLKQWRAKYNEGYLLWPILIVSAGTWLSQQCFRKLYHASLYCSQYMSREMEFKADHHECKIVGSDYFFPLSMRMHQLRFAETKVYAMNKHFGNEGVLLKNIPQAIKVATNNLNKHEQEVVRQSIDTQKDHSWGAQLADNQRIDHARTLNERGIFDVEIEASALFNNYETLCLEQTIATYQSNAIATADTKLIDNDQLFLLKKQDEQSDKLVRISQFGIDLEGRMANIPVKLTKSLSNASLKEIDKRYLEIDQRVKRDVAYYKELRDKRLFQNQAYAYEQAGLKFDYADFQLTESEAKRIKLTLDATESDLKQCEASFNYYDQFITARILAAIKENSREGQELENSHIKALKILKSLKGLEQDLDKLQVYSSCIIGLQKANKIRTKFRKTIAQYQKQLIFSVQAVVQEMAHIKVVNRFSGESLTLLDFAHSWHSEPTIKIEDMNAGQLADYANTIRTALLKQHDLYLKKLLVSTQ